MNSGVPFLTVFPGCEPLAGLCGGLGDGVVNAVNIDVGAMSMEIDAWFKMAPAPAETSELEKSLCGQYSLNRCTINADSPKPEKEQEAKSGVGKLLYGKAPKKSSRAQIISKKLQKPPWIFMRNPWQF